MAEFTQAELAQLDALITRLQEDGADANAVVPLWTPVAAVVARAVVSTAAVLCVKVESDAAKVAQIEELAKSLETTTSLSNLVELRRRAVSANAASVLKSRPS